MYINQYVFIYEKVYSVQYHYGQIEIKRFCGKRNALSADKDRKGVLHIRDTIMNTYAVQATMINKRIIGRYIHVNYSH